MPGSCPSCRSEWWTDAPTCPDCGVDLVDGPLADPEPEAPARSWTDDPPVHESTEFDLPTLDDAARWRVSIELDALGVPHQWVGRRLTVPADAVGIVAEMIEGLDHPVDDGEPATEPVPCPDPDTRDPDRRPGVARIVAWLIDAGAGFAIANAAVAASASIRMSVTSRYTLYWVVVGLTVAVPTVGWGRSIGKALVGLCVERTDGAPVRRRDAAVRCAVALCPLWVPFLPWPRAWSAVTRWSFLGALAAIALSTLLDPEHRGVHDRVAGTTVRRRRIR